MVIISGKRICSIQNLKEHNTYSDLDGVSEITGICRRITGTVFVVKTKRTVSVDFLILNFFALVHISFHAYDQHNHLIFHLNEVNPPRCLQRPVIQKTLEVY